MDSQCSYRVCVKGVAIDSDGRILLAREIDGRWAMLGGGLEHGEDAIDGLKREVLEETGLRVTSVSTAPIGFVTAPQSNAIHYVANIIYEIELESLNFTPSDECLELRYFSLSEMKQLELWPSTQAFCDQLNRSASQA